VIGGAVLALVAAVVEGIPVINWNARFVAMLLYLSFVGSAATNVAWFTEVQHARLDLLATWTLLVPVFGITLSVVVLNERQTAWGWIGTAVVVISLVLLVATTHWNG
jgi:drug/metabolite transporter (DMT)-like permease